MKKKYLQDEYDIKFPIHDKFHFVMNIRFNANTSFPSVLLHAYKIFSKTQKKRPISINLFSFYKSF